MTRLNTFFLSYHEANLKMIEDRCFLFSFLFFLSFFSFVGLSNMSKGKFAYVHCSISYQTVSDMNCLPGPIKARERHSLNTCIDNKWRNGEMTNLPYLSV